MSKDKDPQDFLAPSHYFDYEHPRAEPHELAVGNINAYLVDAPDVLLPNRRQDCHLKKRSSTR